MLHLEDKTAERGENRLKAWLVLHDPEALAYLREIRAQKRVPHAGWTLSEYCRLLRVRLYAQYQEDENSGVSSIGMLTWMQSSYPHELHVVLNRLKEHRDAEEPDEMRAAWVLRDFIRDIYPAIYEGWKKVPHHER